MAEYIDRDKYKNVLMRYLEAPHVRMRTSISEGMRMAIKTCYELLDNERAADVAEIVRCKDCIHHHTFACRMVNPADDDWCKYGERRKADG